MRTCGGAGLQPTPLHFQIAAVQRAVTPGVGWLLALAQCQVPFHSGHSTSSYRHAQEADTQGHERELRAVHGGARL